MGIHFNLNSPQMAVVFISIALLLTILFGFLDLRDLGVDRLQPGFEVDARSLHQIRALGGRRREGKQDNDDGQHQARQVQIHFAAATQIIVIDSPTGSRCITLMTMTCYRPYLPVCRPG